jgi:aminomethyltransferase
MIVSAGPDRNRMPIPSPFHERTAPLCRSYAWKDWAGYCAVCSYDTSHEREYFAFRETAGLLDVSPLFKYEVTGPDATRLLSRMMTRDVSNLKVGRVAYSCWCDDAGRVVDDGTVARLDEDHYRVTAADPSLHWLEDCGRGMNVRLEDSSRRLAALALQGPTSREILRSSARFESGPGIDGLKFFGVTRASIDGVPVWISRTGYTGDLGYEIWMESGQALPVWDALISAGKPLGIEPAGLDALDVTRIEAGFILLGIDYYSAPKVVLEARKSTPLELGFGWMVDPARGNYIGREAILAERLRGPAWHLVGIEVSWEALESLYESFNLPPSLPATARRDGLPVYAEDGRQIGKATSHTWSPILKKYLVIASVHRGFEAKGTPLLLEHTVEFERRKVAATVVPTPFFDPERKRKP